MDNQGRLLGLIWVSAISCRAPILAVGPVLPRIIEDLGLSHTAAGILFALPVLMMGLVSVLGGIVADRVGAARVIGVGLLAVAGTGALRAAGSAAALFGGTALLGGAIGATQAALPRIVRERFAARIGLATAVYSSGFTIGSLLAVTLTSVWLVPLTGGWHGTFLVWAAVSAVPALLWWPHAAAVPRGTAAFDAAAFGAVLKDGLLWRIALLQTMNSAAFYGTTAWLTAYFEHLGWSPARAAWPLAVFIATGALAGFLAPVLSDRIRARRGLLIGTCALSVVGLAGFLVAPGGLVWASSTAYGVGLFASYTINLTLPVDVSPPTRVGAATGVVFSVGHGGGLFGPFLVGLLRDWTGRFESGLVVVLAMLVVMTVLSLSIPETYGGRARRDKAPGS